MNTRESISILEQAKHAIAFAQELPSSPVYNIKNLANNVVRLSARTIKRRINSLEELGLAYCNRGVFTIKREVISQPYTVLQDLIPSLIALKRARRFGKYYKPTDVNFMRKNLPPHSIITLDYRSHELTQFQTPLNLYVYVDDIEDTSKFLKGHGFREGKRGNVILLPKIGYFENQIERVFLDCVANGGRSFLDAAAIMLTHNDMLKTRVRFTGSIILKVQEDTFNEPID